MNTNTFKMVRVINGRSSAVALFLATAALAAENVQRWLLPTKVTKKEPPEASALHLQAARLLLNEGEIVVAPAALEMEGFATPSSQGIKKFGAYEITNTELKLPKMYAAGLVVSKPERVKRVVTLETALKSETVTHGLIAMRKGKDGEKAPTKASAARGLIRIWLDKGNNEASDISSIVKQIAETCGFSSALAGAYFRENVKKVLNPPAPKAEKVKPEPQKRGRKPNALAVAATTTEGEASTETPAAETAEA